MELAALMRSREGTRAGGQEERGVDSVERGQGAGDRANKFIGLLSERYTGLSPGSRARREGRRERERKRERERDREGDSLERGRARKIVKTLYNSAEGRYSGHLDDREERGRDKGLAERRGSKRQIEAPAGGGVGAGRIQ